MLIFQLILNLLLIQDPPPGAGYDRGRDCFDTEAFALPTLNPAVAKVFCLSLKPNTETNAKPNTEANTKPNTDANALQAFIPPAT